VGTGTVLDDRDQRVPSIQCWYWTRKHIGYTDLGLQVQKLQADIMPRSPVGWPGLVSLD